MNTIALKYCLNVALQESNSVKILAFFQKCAAQGHDPCGLSPKAR